MRKKPKILIADSSDDFRDTIARALKDEFDILMSSEGNHTLQVLCRERPDLLVMDISLPGLDGLSVLERAAAAGVEQPVLITALVVSDYIQNACKRLGVDFIMVKPCDRNAVIRRIRDIYRIRASTESSHTELWRRLTERLMQMRFSILHKGSRYLCEAVIMQLEDMQSGLTKEIYPAIAARNHTSGKSVERDIRSAMEKAWLLREPGLWPACFSRHRKRPTNGHLIAALCKELLPDTCVREKE